MSKLQLRGKIALVTGAGRGIGKATAKLLAKNGAEVVLTARTTSEIDKVAENIVGNNGLCPFLGISLTAVSSPIYFPKSKTNMVDWIS